MSLKVLQLKVWNENWNISLSLLNHQIVLEILDFNEANLIQHKILLISIEPLVHIETYAESLE